MSIYDLYQKQLRTTTFPNLSLRKWLSFYKSVLSIILHFPVRLFPQSVDIRGPLQHDAKHTVAFEILKRLSDISYTHFLCFLSVPRRLWIRTTCFHQMKAATSSHQLCRKPTSTPPRITHRLWASTTSLPWIHPAATCTADAKRHTLKYISCFLRGMWPRLHTLIRPCSCIGKCMDPQKGRAHNLHFKRCRKTQRIVVRIKRAHVVFL